MPAPLKLWPSAVVADVHKMLAPGAIGAMFPDLAGLTPVLSGFGVSRPSVLYALLRGPMYKHCGMPAPLSLRSGSMAGMMGAI